MDEKDNEEGMKEKKKNWNAEDDEMKMKMNRQVKELAEKMDGTVKLVHLIKKYVGANNHKK